MCIAAVVDITSAPPETEISEANGIMEKIQLKLTSFGDKFKDANAYEVKNELRLNSFLNLV